MPIVFVFLPLSARLYSDILHGIKRRLGADVEIQTIDYLPNKAELSSLLDFWRPIGSIVVGAEGIQDLAARAFGEKPVVYLDRTPLTRGNFLDVTLDYDENGKVAARTLLECEVTNYAFVGNKAQSSWSTARGVAFAKFIRLHGKNCQVFNVDSNVENRPMVLGSWLKELPKPVGIFAANDRTALEIHKICLRHNIAIPDDVSILGFDNVADICETASPTISSIMFDGEQSGWISADLLLERLNNPALKKALRHYPILGVIHRASTRKKNRYHASLSRVLNLIRERACDGLTIQDIAAAMGCSQRMAEIRFQNGTNGTIKQAITNVRMCKADVLIRSRNMELRAIARSCGYGTESALRIAYRKHFGTSIASVRQTLRNSSFTP